MSYIEKCALLTGGLEVSFSIYYLQTVFVPKSVLAESQAGSGSKLFGTLRPKEKYALFPITCPKFLGSVHVGRQTFFLYWFLSEEASR